MSVNKHQQHVLVLPEDDANRQLAVGFHQEIASDRQFQVLPVAGGWNAVLSQFESEQVAGMHRHAKRFMVLLIDFDGQEDRLTAVQRVIPDVLRDRVFILGAWTEPEALRAGLGSYESIGRAMARDCRDGTSAIWGHELLRHNVSEVERLRERVRPILFP